MILTESRSLAGVLNNLAGRYLASIAATNGQVGGFLRTDIAPALVSGQRVLYLGDFDGRAGRSRPTPGAYLNASSANSIGGGSP